MENIPIFALSNKSEQRIKSSDFHRPVQLNGWNEVRQAGSHIIYEKNGKRVAVPYHGSKEIGKGLFQKLKKEIYDMKTIKAIIDRAADGTYSVYCEEAPSFLGMGDTIDQAKEEMLETIRLTKEEIGREAAAVYPDWLDGEYEIEYKYDVQGFLEYYAGVITPTALGKIAGINPKQMWNYMHGVAKPRKAQVDKIESALHKLGNELIHTSF